jgi:hypothetical protein
MPEITLRQIHEFLRSVDEGRWVGDGSVWIAAERADADPHAFACTGDHMRALPLPAKVAAPAPAASAAVKRVGRPSREDAATRRTARRRRTR